MCTFEMDIWHTEEAFQYSNCPPMCGAQNCFENAHTFLQILRMI